MELNSQKANVWDHARDSCSVPYTPSLRLFQDTLSHQTLFWKAVVTALLSDKGITTIFKTALNYNQG